MASVSNEQFLSLCIKHMEGQINFKEVAKESGSTEGAVRIRWKRYKDKLNAAAPATSTGDADGDDEPAGGTATPKKTPKKQTPKKQTPAKKATPKKRKLDGSDAEDPGESVIKEEGGDNDD